MEMFECKEGIRIYKRKADAEFAAERSAKVNGSEAEIRKIRVLDEEAAQEKGLSVRPDLSIAAEAPEEGESGWITVKEKGDELKHYDEVLEVIEE